MMREGKKEAEQSQVDDALEPPNVIDVATGAPAWWTSDEDNWAEFERQVR